MSINSDLVDLMRLVPGIWIQRAAELIGNIIEADRKGEKINAEEIKRILESKL